MLAQYKDRLYRLLRWSERYTKTDMVYLAKGSFWLNVSQIGGAFIAFLLSIAFANLLDPQDYGTYKFLLALYTLFGSFTLSGLPTAIVRAVARGHEGEYRRGLIINFFWSLLITLLAALGALYYFWAGNALLAAGILFIGVFLPLIDTGELYGSYYSGKKNFTAVGLLRLLRALISSIGVFIALIVTHNPLFIALTYFAVNAFVVCAFTWWSLITYHPNYERDYETMRLGWHISLMNGFSSFVDQLDNILIFHFLGATSLAVYNFAQAIPEQLAGMLKNINSLATPQFSKRDKYEVIRSIGEKTFRLFLVGAAMYVAYFIGAPIVFHLFFPRYDASIGYSQLYGLILLFSASIPLAFLDSQVAIQEKYFLNLTGAVIKLVLLVGGVLLWGIWGIVFAKVLGKALSVLLAHVIAQRMS